MKFVGFLAVLCSTGALVSCKKPNAQPPQDQAATLEEIQSQISDLASTQNGSTCSAATDCTSLNYFVDSLACPANPPTDIVFALTVQSQMQSLVNNYIAASAGTPADPQACSAVTPDAGKGFSPTTIQCLSNRCMAVGNIEYPANIASNPGVVHLDILQQQIANLELGSCQADTDCTGQNFLPCSPSTGLATDAVYPASTAAQITPLISQFTQALSQMGPFSAPGCPSAAVNGNYVCDCGGNSCSSSNTGVCTSQLQ